MPRGRSGGEGAFLKSGKDGRSGNLAGLCHVSDPTVKPELVWPNISMRGRCFESSFVA